MIVRAPSAKRIDAIVVVALALREIRNGFSGTSASDADALAAIQRQLVAQAARLDFLDAEDPRR